GVDGRRQQRVDRLQKLLLDAEEQGRRLAADRRLGGIEPSQPGEDAHRALAAGGTPVGEILVGDGLRREGGSGACRAERAVELCRAQPELPRQGEEKEARRLRLRRRALGRGERRLLEIAAQIVERLAPRLA